MTRQRQRLRWLTPTQVQEQTGIHRKTVIYLINKGRLPAITNGLQDSGLRYRVSQAELDKYLKAHQFVA